MQGLVNTMFFPALDMTRKTWNYLNKMCQVFHEVHSNLRANSERETNSDIHLC